VPVDGCVMALSPYPDCAERVALYLVAALSLLSIAPMRLSAHGLGGGSYLVITFGALAGAAACVAFRRRGSVGDSAVIAFAAVAVLDPYLRRHLAPNVTATIFAFAGGAASVVAVATARSSASRARRFRGRLTAAGADTASRAELERYLRATGARVKALETRTSPLLRRLRHRHGRAADTPVLRVFAASLDAYAAEAQAAWRPSWIAAALEHDDDALFPRLAAECRAAGDDLERGRAVDLPQRLASLRRELLAANREWYYALAIVASWHHVRLPRWFRKTSRRLACSR
jgi:hypothetical protein